MTVIALLLFFCSINKVWGMPPLLPEKISQTRLYTDLPRDVVSGSLLSFYPLYPLWSYGAHKRRWIYLPPGTQIDSSRMDQWSFPPGTQFYKEFSFPRPDGKLHKL